MIETVAQQGVAPHVGDEHVGVGEEVHEDRLALLGRVVERDPALAAVVHLERRVLGAADGDLEVGTETPVRVTGERLDLDDVCTPVAEDGCGGRRGHPEPHLDDLDPLHRSHGPMVGQVS